MVLDSSAVVAMAFKEPGFEKLFEKIAVSETVLIGAPTVVECSIVVARRIQENSRLIVQDALDDFEQLTRIVIYGDLAEHNREGETSSPEGMQSCDA